MAYVIAQPCIGTKDTACVAVCPVDCIHPTKDEAAFAEAEMLYIDPDTCIDCNLCVDECPVKAIFPQEVPATLKLYLAGKIDQWWARQDQKGPVFLMNVTTIEEARALLDELPLGQAKLMEFEFTELSPLTPLHLLIQEA